MKTAHVYRMHSDKHICPFGLRVKDVLKRNGYQVEDHIFTERASLDRFKEEQGVKTMPQVYIEGERIGGFEATCNFLGIKTVDKTKTTYKPIIAIFATTFLLAVAAVFSIHQKLIPFEVLHWFLALSLAVLAIQKLRDLNGFVNQFIVYDILAMRWLRYGCLYPFLEVFTAIGMISKYLPLLKTSAVVAIIIGGIGAISVIKAVYIQKRDIKCACVGGNSNVPLGFVSLTENIMMIIMGLMWLI